MDDGLLGPPWVVVAEYLEITGAILAGRADWDVARKVSLHGRLPSGGAREGLLFILTHHPDDAAPAEGGHFLSCDVAEAVRIALEAAGSKNVDVFSATIGHQLLKRGLIDEIDLHIARVLLGDGIRLFDSPGGAPIRLEQIDADDPVAAVNVRYRLVVAKVAPTPPRNVQRSPGAGDSSCV